MHILTRRRMEREEDINRRVYVSIGEIARYRFLEFKGYRVILWLVYYLYFFSSSMCIELVKDYIDNVGQCLLNPSSILLVELTKLS